MLLHKFMNIYEEAKAERKVRDYFSDSANGNSRIEFLGHFLSSVYQPILSFNGAHLETIGYEAFVRPVAGNEHVSPVRYFEELEPEHHFFADRLCRDLHVTNFLKQAQDHETISLNISPLALAENATQLERLTTQIQIAQKNGLNSERIYLEIAMTPELDPGEIYTFTHQLREKGLKITLEDFDADCASFSRIIFARPDVVKFNRTWLDGNLNDAAYIELVSNVVRGIAALGTKTHLERIESKREFTFAIACGFDFLQGYYLGEPNAQLKRATYNLPVNREQGRGRVYRQASSKGYSGQPV
ncbi:MAG: EAL domain-containing protein [Rhizobiaceae bacterium]